MSGVRRASAEPGAAARPWLNPAFARLWAAQATSAAGARISRDGLPLAAVLVLGAGPAQMGALAAAAAAPSLLVGLLAGGFVDRGAPRRVLVGADLGRALILGAVCLGGLTGSPGILALWLAAAAVRALSELFDIADHALLPALVRRTELAAANARLAASESIAEVGGPALAGTLFTVLSATGALGFNALTYLASGVLLIGLPANGPRAARRARAASAAAFRVGMKALAPLAWATAISAGFGAGFQALYILYAVRTLGLTPLALGLTISVGGAGALAGAGAAAWLTRRFGLDRATVGAWFASGLAAFLIPLAPAGGAGMAMLMAAQLLGDAAGTAALIGARTTRQNRVAAEALGRSAAAFAAISGAATIAGALAAGLIAEAWSVRAALWLAAAGCAAAPLALFAGRRSGRGPDPQEGAAQRGARSEP